MAIVTLWASAPGTGSSGSGAEGSPYTGLNQALTALGTNSPGSTLKLKAGTYTVGQEWNSVTYANGSAGNPYYVQPETYTQDTTRGIPGGTSNVIWRPPGGSPSAINMALGKSYWTFRGIDFDGVNQTPFDHATLTPQTFLVSLNNGTNNMLFRNCHFRNWKLVAVELANSSGGVGLLNNQFIYNKFSHTGANNGEVAHCHYWRSSGNVLAWNDFDGTGTTGWESCVQLFNPGTSTNVSTNDNAFHHNIIRNLPSYDDNNAVFLFSLNCKRNAIYNNLIYNCPAKIAVDLRGGSGVNGEASGNIVAYNTIVGCLKGVSVGTQSTGFSGTVVKSNIAYDNGSSAADNYYNNGSGTDAGGNSFDNTDPKFTNAGAGNYSLNPATTTIGTSGVAVGSPYDDGDMDGLARGLNGTYTPGAYEIDEGVTPIPTVNVYPNPSGISVTKNTPTVLTPSISVNDANTPSALFTSVSFYINGGGTFTWSGDGTVS